MMIKKNKIKSDLEVIMEKKDHKVICSKCGKEISNFEEHVCEDLPKE